MLVERLKRPIGVEKGPAIDLGPAALDAPDQVGSETDHRIAAAHGAALDRFQQKTVPYVAGELEHRRDRGLQVRDEAGRHDLRVAAVISDGEFIDFWGKQHGKDYRVSRKGSKTGPDQEPLPDTRCHNSSLTLMPMAVCNSVR